MIGVNGVYKAFKDLRPRAFRADLWRVVNLWDKGGIYMDAKFFFTTDIDWIDFENDDLILCADHGANFNSVMNGLVVMSQYHPGALNYIMEAVRNI